MSKTPEEMLLSMIRNLEQNSGKSLTEWVRIARGSGQEKHGAMVKFLKAEWGLTHGYANLVAHKALESDAASIDDPVAGQYKGKESLRPVYDAIVKAVQGFGSDVDISPKKSYVSLRRKKQFAIVQPTTRTRIDVGINLKSGSATERLEPSGSFNQMVSHRVRVASPSEVDEQLVSWLREAYDEA